jgi:aminoglycoside phosphotransferase (APT) family kinase protein
MRPLQVKFAEIMKANVSLLTFLRGRIASTMTRALCATSRMHVPRQFRTSQTQMATYTAMAGFSVGHCKAFVVHAAERAADSVQGNHRVTIYPRTRGDDREREYFCDSELREAGFETLTAR